MTGDPHQPGSEPPAPPTEETSGPRADPEPTGTRPRRLIRRWDDRMLGGVAAGTAHYLDTDPALIRIGWVALTLLTSGFAALAYLAMWIVVPEEEHGPSGLEADAPGGASTEGTRARATRTPDARRQSGGWGGLVWGVILIAIGGVALLTQLDIMLPSWRAIAALLLTLTGLVMTVTAGRGLNGGLLLLAVLLTAVLAGSTARLPAINMHSGFGERTTTVTAPGDVEASYGHAFGAMHIQFAEGALRDGTTSVSTSIAFGDLRIAVPEDVGVRVRATTVFGSTHVMDRKFDALGDEQLVTTPGYEQAAKRLDLTLTTAFGSSRVSRGQP